MVVVVVVSVSLVVFSSLLTSFVQLHVNPSASDLSPKECSKNVHSNNNIMIDFSDNQDNGLVVGSLDDSFFKLYFLWVGICRISS